MKKRIVVLTATRSEYGLLSGVIKRMLSESDLDVRVVATGMHLSPEFGLTYREIEEDGIVLDRKIEILLGSDTASGMSKTMGMAMISFSDYFEEIKPDALLVLGDRYETLAVCCVAMNAQIPIIHLHGGETTEGAVDEAVRHSITKMSYLHLTSTEEYRRRVIQLGEQPDRAFNVGALGVENVLKCSLMSKEELSESLGVVLDRPYSVVTFHPTTLERGEVTSALQILFDILIQNKNMLYIVTKANADQGGRAINERLDTYASNNSNICVFESLGLRRYLSAVRHCEMVIGNSSSGLLEVPSFKIPTINIGDRQKGRIKADSVIDCAAEGESILNAIEKAQSIEFKKICEAVDNPYEGKDTSKTIVKLIKEKVLFARVDLKKPFYDLKSESIVVRG